VRGSVGFKNVSLANVLSARDSKARVTFLQDGEDQALFSALIGPSFEVQVGLHELLGHGSGKVCTEAPDGSMNFDPAATLDLAGQPTATWYKNGATWDTSFGAFASGMEECRAEAVGIVLCTQPAVLDIFHVSPEGSARADLIYVNWLNMARAGLLALQFYNPATQAWGQAHMQARFALLRVMLEAGAGFVELRGGAEALDAAAVAAGAVEEGAAGVHVALDRAKIASVGLPAVAAFLRALQVAKSTADVARGTALFARYIEVPAAWLPLRALVVAKRRPRQSFVQPALELAGAAREGALGAAQASPAQAAVVLRTFPGTLAGAVDAFVTRFAEVDEAALQLWREEAAFHRY
jgi:dipeptidyl-peptidase-3